MGFQGFPTTDAFQQVIYTPVGTIDVIAMDQVARRENARLVSSGLSRAFAALRSGFSRLVHAASSRHDGPFDERISASRF
jgi:hypothetical protein